MAELVVDTNFLVALIDAGDRWQEAAGGIEEALLETQHHIIYFDCVIGETISVLGRRLEEKGRSQEFGALLFSLCQRIPIHTITWIFPEAPSRYERILNLVEQHQGTLNFHDALIGLAMQDRGCRYLVSFDRDFDNLPWIKRIDSQAGVKAILVS